MRGVSQYGMPYCALHNRLFPHPCVGWLTPQGVQGLAIIQARCDVCRQEAQRDALLRYAWTALSSPATGGDHLKT
jgi:hypothetical protein